MDKPAANPASLDVKQQVEENAVEHGDCLQVHCVFVRKLALYKNQSWIELPQNCLVQNGLLIDVKLAHYSRKQVPCKCHILSKIHHSAKLVLKSLDGLQHSVTTGIRMALHDLE